MSQMGHSRRFPDVRAAAALLSTTAVMLQCRERRNVPKAVIGPLTRRVYRRGEERRRDARAASAIMMRGPPRARSRHAAPSQRDGMIGNTLGSCEEPES